MNQPSARVELFVVAQVVDPVELVEASRSSGRASPRGWSEMPSVVAPASFSPTTKRNQFGGKCGDRKTTFTERPSVMAVSFRDARQIWHTATIGSDSEGPAMKIALVAPPLLPVPPLRYGGVERIVGVLADGLLQRGHDVTLFAPGDSRFGGRLVATVPSGLWNDGFAPTRARISEAPWSRCSRSRPSST